MNDGATPLYIASQNGHSDVAAYLVEQGADVAAKDKNGFTVDLDDGFGYALQAGADIGIQGPWSLNVDVKKVWFNTDADVNDGALKSDVDLDPWVVSVGVGRKF